MYRKIGEGAKRMNVLLLCECKSSEVGIQIRNAVQDLLEREGHSVQTIILNSKELKPCVACLGCWLKTPGQCLITNDEANRIAAQLINANAVILISEIVYGGFSADMKAFLDRSLQTMLPYFENYKGETHHPMRYKHFPIWIAVGYGNVSDAEKNTFTILAEKNALNMRPVKYLAVTVRNSNELVKETGNILKTLEVGV